MAGILPANRKLRRFLIALPNQPSSQKKSPFDPCLDQKDLIVLNTTGKENDTVPPSDSQYL
jgi:hypothetical protein